jgi:PQQ-like domain
MPSSRSRSLRWSVPYAAFLTYVIAVSGAAAFVTIAPPNTGSSSTAVLPSGGAFNTPGNLLIADQYNNRVIEVNPHTDQIVWSFGSGNGSLCNPGNGSVIGPNDAERLAGGLTLIAGSGIPAGSPFPACADNRVIIVNEQGDIVWQYGQAGINGSGPDLLNVPVFAIQLPNKDIMIVDQGNNRVIEVNYTTKQIDWSYGPTSGPGMLNDPNSVQLLTGGDVLIADQGNNRVITVNSSGDILWQYDKGLNTTAFASRLPNNDTLIVDSDNARILEISSQGDVVWQYFTNQTKWGSSAAYPSNAVRLASGETIITDTPDDRVIVVDNASQIIYQYGKMAIPGVGADELNGPYSCYMIGDYYGQTLPPGVSPADSEADG